MDELKGCILEFDKADSYGDIISKTAFDNIELPVETVVYVGNDFKIDTIGELCAKVGVVKDLTIEQDRLMGTLCLTKNVDMLKNIIGQGLGTFTPGFIGTDFAYVSLSFGPSTQIGGNK